MLKVSDEVKSAYNSDSCIKSLKVIFPELNLTFNNEQIISESFKLKESVLEGDSLEFIGCISSYMSVQIHNLEANVKNRRVEVYVTDNVTNTEIPLFVGVVDSATKKGYEGVKTIEAYDDLYHLGEIDVTDWYNEHPTTTVQRLLVELAELSGFEIDKGITMPNGMVTAFCGLYNQASQLSALILLKQICQINGGFGRINRYGKFDMLFLTDELAIKRFPATILFPFHDYNLYPNQPGTVEPTKRPDFTFPFYENVEFEEFNVKAIDKVVIRDYEDEKGVFYGTGNNKYIIQGNLFAFGQTQLDLQVIAGQIYKRTNGTSFTPFNSKNYGLPWVECGDNVYYKDIDGEEEIKRSFFVFSRTLSGIQYMKDTYTTKGQENQSEFITDLGSQIKNLTEQIKKEKEKDEIEELRKRVARLEALVGSVRTVTGLPVDSPISEALWLDVAARESVVDVVEG